MCRDVLQDPTFFRFLSRIDYEFAAETRAGRCPGCEGPLHVANYPRKPRGCPAAVREEYSRRLSFTCGRCEARSTSPSVRSAGCRVYLAMVLMLRSPRGNGFGQELCDLFNIPTRTLKRWRTWWREGFPTTRFWQSMRERFNAAGRSRRTTPKLGEPLRERVDVRSIDAGTAMEGAVEHADADQVIRGSARLRRRCR